jgi:hypothetical protein
LSLEELAMPPDLDLIKQVEQGVRDRRGQFAGPVEAIPRPAARLPRSPMQFAAGQVHATPICDRLPPEGLLARRQDKPSFDL